jgi:hypothetical protein
MSEYSSEFVVRSSGVKLTTKNAWALYVRRRWKDGNGVKCAMAEWNLTEGEAKGLFAGQISQPTIEKINDHPRGGMRLSALIHEIRFQTAWTAFFQSEAERIAREAEEQRKTASRIYSLSRRLGSLNPVSDPGHSVSDFPPQRPGADAPAWLADGQD